MNRLAEQRNRRRSIEEHLALSVALKERLSRERDEAAGEHLRVSEEAAGLGERAQTQKRSVEDLRASVAKAESDLAAARVRLDELTAALAVARERETAAGSALRTLQDVATRFAGVSDGVRLVLSSGGSAGVRSSGVVADFVEASREIEAAAEAYLQSVLPAVVVEDDADARLAAGLIRAEGAGRTTFLSKTRGQGTNGHGPLPAELSGDQRVLGRLKDRLRFRRDDGLVASCIGDAVLVDSLESALALHRVFPKVDYLAPTGEVVYASGLIAAGGRAAGDHGLLAHNRKTAEAQEELTEATARAGSVQDDVDRARAEFTRAESALAEGRRELESEGKLGNELEMQRVRTDDERERAGRRLAVLAEEIEAAAAEGARLAAELTSLDETVRGADAEHARTEGALQAESAALETEETERDPE
jgi:chromosome segregation protein